MKKIFLFIIIVASLSCNTNRQAATNTQAGLLNLSHYYLKNSVELNSNYNGMVIANEGDFNTLFYAESPADKNLVIPDFKGQFVVALALNRNGNDKMMFAKAEITNNAINIYGSRETIQSETDSPVAVAAVPKCSDAKQVNFFVDGELVKSVTLSLKRAGSFANNKHSEHEATAKEERKALVII